MTAISTKSVLTIPRDSSFFLAPESHLQRQYEALRAFFVEQLPSVEAARRFGYTPGSFRVLCHQSFATIPTFASGSSLASLPGGIAVDRPARSHALVWKLPIVDTFRIIMYAIHPKCSTTEDEARITHLHTRN